MEDGTPVVDLWDDVVQVAVSEIRRTFRVARPALVRTVDRAASRIVAALMGRFVGTDLQAREEPEVPDIPVIHYAGGGYALAFDMRPDDPAVVICCDGPVRGFYETGLATTPLTGQGHDYGSAVAFPGGRVSATDQPTLPANAPGEFFMGAADGSAAVLVRGAGLTSPDELGSVVVQVANPVAGVKLGGDDASVGVGRLGDGIAPTAAMSTVLSALAAAVNTLAPGSVNPTTLAQALVKMGTISEASTMVVSK